MRAVSVFGLEKIGLVKPGDDLAELILDSLRAESLELMDDDVLVVSQKVVSKAEGLLVDITMMKAGRKAESIAKRTRKDPRLVELILKDSVKVVAADDQALVVQRRDGLVCINAGVDKSNVRGRTVYARLPQRPDESASALRIELEERTGKRVAVIVADTYSRPLRVGQAEFAIGISGIEPIVDYRGRQDMFGYELHYKFVAIADEIAAAAELVMGQGTEQVPIAIVRGLTRLVRTESQTLSKKLLLGRRRDLFSKIFVPRGVVTSRSK